MEDDDKIFAYELLIQRDDVQAESKLIKLAEEGDADAMYVLGIAYYDVDIPGKTPMQGMQYLEQASKLGHVKATHDLGCFHYYGYRLPEDFRDFERAAELLEYSASQGFTPSMTFLGSMYKGGEGVERNIEKARRLYQEALSLGDPNAKDLLENLDDA